DHRELICKPPSLPTSDQLHSFDHVTVLWIDPFKLPVLCIYKLPMDAEERKEEQPDTDHHERGYKHEIAGAPCGKDDRDSVWTAGRVYGGEDREHYWDDRVDAGETERDSAEWLEPQHSILCKRSKPQWKLAGPVDNHHGISVHEQKT